MASNPKFATEQWEIAWRDFAPLRAHLRVAHGHGPEAVQRVYLEMVEGRVDPSEGQILSLWNESR